MTIVDRTVRPYSSLARSEIGVPPPGFRLPDDTKIGRVVLQIADLDRSVGFYRDVIGFHLIDRIDDASHRSASLGIHPADLPGPHQSTPDVLLELREKPGAQPVPRRGRLGIYHFAVLLPSRGDLGRFLRRATQLGVHVGAADHFYSEATYLVDPDGITVEVYRDRPITDWVIDASGEVVGTTEPFDFAGVSAAGGSDQYAGLPVGTRIGHMHFFVGDLAQGEAFYHAALGFSKVNWSFPGALFVSAGGYHHHVGLNTWAAGAPVATDADARLLIWDLRLPDRAGVEAAADALRRGGVSVTASDGGYLAADPWGTVVHLRRD